MLGKMYGPEPAPTGWNAELEELQRLAQTLGINNESINMEEYVEPNEERIGDTGDDLFQRVADAYSMVQPEEDEAGEQGEQPLVKAKDALGALDTLLLWENQQEHPDLETVKILERYSTRFGMIRLRDFQKNAQQTSIQDFFKTQCLD